MIFSAFTPTLFSLCIVDASNRHDSYLKNHVQSKFSNLLLKEVLEILLNYCISLLCTGCLNAKRDVLNTY